ncbi:tyrosine-type recombinase/integrase [Clostridium sp. UBA4548]|uniref:tyrosine-type recombinase/integrase n=1 Tax=Clostridium sp. UBA4548 TaxID=1946361 RepID=UPI0039C86A1A
MTVHELRHTYARRLISSGIDLQTAAKLLCHTVEQTMKTYSHVNDDMMVSATSIKENIL